MFARCKTTKRHIIGTSETIEATAKILGGSFVADPNGGVDFEYGGESDVHWDTQRTCCGPNRERLFVDDTFIDVLESDVELIATAAECGECGRLYALDELQPVGTEPLTPGELVPAGTCPDCGGWAYDISAEEEED